jgi:hypothetical protein
LFGYYRVHAAYRYAAPYETASVRKIMRPRRERRRGGRGRRRRRRRRRRRSSSR